MYTLGSNFIPAASHAGGLRYHGMNPTLSELYDQGLMEATSVEQTSVFAAAEYFARIEGILPAPESSHAIKVALDEAIKCKETGEEKTILFGLTGTGYFDMMSYEKFHDGKLGDYRPTDEELAKAFEKISEDDDWFGIKSWFQKLWLGIKKAIMDLFNISSLGVAGLILLAGTDLSVGRMVALGAVTTGLILHPGMNIVTVFGMGPWNFTPIPMLVRVLMALVISIVLCVVFSSFAGVFTARTEKQQAVDDQLRRQRRDERMYLQPSGKHTGERTEHHAQDD